jgi:hypothetical protein
MIKIQLLPPHMLERRRVKKWAVLAILILLIETAAFLAYVWGPVPWSLSSKLSDAKERDARVLAELTKCREMEAEIGQIQARYAGKKTWVTWVEKADALPARWREYFEELNTYVPADVVLSGIPLPSGTTLTLNGSTSDVMAAMRWYLNMLRCEMVEPHPQFVDIQTTPDPASWEAPRDGANPKMRHSVTIRVQLKVEELDMLLMPPGVPGDAGVGGAGRGRGGGRMGMGGRGMGGRGGGGGGRGGRGRGGGMGRGPRRGPRGM